MVESEKQRKPASEHDESALPTEEAREEFAQVCQAKNDARVVATIKRALSSKTS